jgi:hypothetical protein
VRHGKYGRRVFTVFKYPVTVHFRDTVVYAAHKIYATNNVYVAHEGGRGPIVRTIVNYYQTYCHCLPDECVVVVVVVAVCKTRAHTRTFTTVRPRPCLLFTDHNGLLVMTIRLTIVHAWYIL